MYYNDTPLTKETEMMKYLYKLSFRIFTAAISGFVVRLLLNRKYKGHYDYQSTLPKR